MNIRDVAKRAKVSTATVSRVMSGMDVVKPATVARVRKAVDELGYVPNSSARTLSMGRSRLFGVIISDITNPFFPDLIHTFNELSVQHKYRAVFANTNYSPAGLKAAIQSLLEQKVEGIAIMTSEITAPLVQMIATRSIPLVVAVSPAAFYETLSQKNVSNILVDYHSGMQQAVDHILALGHKHIAFIGGPQTMRSAAWRQNVFLQVLREKGILLDGDYMATGNYRVDGGNTAMRKLLQCSQRPTAVLASNDLMAIGAISAIYEAGLQVPRDISVIGFDDLEISSAYNPPVTTVRISRTEIATRAFFALYSASNVLAAPPAEHLIETELIVRKSTAPPRL